MSQDNTTRREIAESIFGKAEEQKSTDEVQDSSPETGSATGTGGNETDSESLIDRKAGTAESDVQNMEQEEAIETEAPSEQRKENSDITEEDTGTAASDTEEASGIKINVSVLQDKGQIITSSPTDLNGIALFTNEYEKNVAAVEERNRKEAERLKDSLFIERKNEPDQYEQLRQILFTGEQEQVIKETFTPKKDNPMGMIAGVAVLAAIAVILIVTWFDRRSRKRREDAIDNYTY